MSDWYRNFANSGVGTTITKQLGLPRPAVLRRYEPGQALLPGPAVIGSAGEGRLRDALTALLGAEGVHVQSPPVTADGLSPSVAPSAVTGDWPCTPAPCRSWVSGSRSRPSPAEPMTAGPGSSACPGW